MPDVDVANAMWGERLTAKVSPGVIGLHEHFSGRDLFALGNDVWRRLKSDTVERNSTNRNKDCALDLPNIEYLQKRTQIEQAHRSNLFPVECCPGEWMRESSSVKGPKIDIVPPLWVYTLERPKIGWYQT